MNKIQTAEELLANNLDGLKDIIDDDDLFYFYKGVVCEFAKALAEIHVTEALKYASENFTMKMKDDVYDLDMNDDWMEVDKDSILNAYPLELIK